MKKVKYFYNTQTLKYEKLVTSVRVKVFRVVGFLSAAIVTGFLFLAVSFKFLDSPREKTLRHDLAAMNERYEALQSNMKEVKGQLTELQRRDNDIYRVIFEASPIPDSSRAGAKSEEQLVQDEYANNSDIVKSTGILLQELLHRITVQEKSYKEIDDLVKNKQKMLASIPAIQPVSNKELKRIASGFGYRIDPIYKTEKYHSGLDFAAPAGTPIYATGDGTVEDASQAAVGYGNHVLINHGYGYKTMYGHMLKIKVHDGEAVKRGEVIGWVGSTGKSTGPHCHYEVIKNGEKVDPVYFFFSDLTPDQFDEMLKIARSGNQSFD